MKQPFTFPKCEGVYNKQAHCDIPKGLYEREHGRDGFFGAASHILHQHMPTGWTEWEGPLQPHSIDLNKLDTTEMCPWTAHAVMSNANVRVRMWKTGPGKMTHLVRNGDGDDLLFVHTGAGDIFCDYGHMSFRDGDYIIMPRGTAWRVESNEAVQLLMVEATEDFYQLPDRGLAGRHALFDPAVLETPKINDQFKAQQGEFETRVRIKRRNQITTVTFPFNPLDAVGWHGDCVPVKLNWRDIREMMSDRYHLPPSAHTTFLARAFVICTFAPRPLESDPGALKVPFFHNNDEYDETIFYHKGNFFSRDNIGPGMMTLHPSGFAHGPHPKAFALAEANNTGERRYTDEVAVMIDTRFPVDLAPLPEGVEDKNYLNSWKPKK
jgi:homogentisate 1,2-dioxygenase